MKIFSVPLNPKLSEKEYFHFLEFLQKYKDWIYDVYFTSRIAPFHQDAMGDVFKNDGDYEQAILAARNIQDALGIPISATFNNIQVPPTQENLDLWIENFKPYYDAGIHIATIPHTHWVATGQIQEAFPKLMIKNTILRDVHTATEVVNLAQIGFHYINLDRDLMRDRDALLRIKEAKEYCHKNGMPIKLSLLANEGCLGQCSFMVEHFEYNNTRGNDAPQYFNAPSSRVSCTKWEYQDNALSLKAANFAPWREDWVEFIEELGIDVIKMHGREASSRLLETMDIIKRFANGDEILFDQFNDYIADNNLEEKPIDVWRKKIKTCKFDCWDCHYCDKIYDKKATQFITPMVSAMADIVEKSATDNIIINIKGLTSPRVQKIINHTAKLAGNYLEIGTAMGATLASALRGNTIKAWAIDNWSQTTHPENGNFDMPENKYEKFASAIEPYVQENHVHAIDADFLQVNKDLIDEPVKFMFYDGPHDHESTRNAVLYYADKLDNEAVLIFDDANWDGIVSGADEGIKKAGLEILYHKKILNGIESSKDWWNGLYIVVVRK